MFYFCEVEKVIIYIEKLLVTNDHVVVPGLGAFIIQNASAQIRDGIVIPPSASVSFNALICDTDGALALEIARSQKISYKEAAAIIRGFVKNLLETLHKEDFVLGQLGVFIAGKTQTLEFVPFERPKLLPQNFAFSSIDVRTDDKKHLKNIKQNRARWIQYAAVFLALITLLIPGNVNQNQKISRADLSFIRTMTLDEVSTIKELKSETETETINVPILNTTYYNVVVAVYQTEEKANLLCAEIAQKYPDSKVIKGSNDYRVVINSFDNLSSAVNYMEQIRHLDTRFPDAWVMKSAS